jgi:heme/copper-type cytochrome/quinol oxidase subunit 2
LFLTTIPGEDFSDQMLKELEELPGLIEENRVTYDAYIMSHSYMAEPPAEMYMWIKGNTGNIYKTFDSYMVPVTELSKGDLRLLEEDNPLRVETHKHIRFLITASDVLHSFAVPSLGIKVDAVPGRLNQISAFITREGVFYGQCSELCGVNHGFMPIKIIGVHVRKFE